MCICKKNNFLFPSVKVENDDEEASTAKRIKLEIPCEKAIKEKVRGSGPTKAGGKFLCYTCEDCTFLMMFGLLSKSQCETSQPCVKSYISFVCSSSVT